MPHAAQPSPTPSPRAPRGWRAAGRRLALAAAASLAAVAPAHALESFKATYDAWYHGHRAGDGVMRLAPAGGNRWTYSMDVRGTSGMAAITGADLSQSTTFEVVDGRWRPLSGTDSSKLLFKSSTRKATYDWRAGEARWTGDVKPERAGPVRLNAGDLDGMLLNLALPRDLAAGKPLTYRLVENGRAKQHRYVVSGKESITYGGREHQATKVVRSDGDKQTIAWIVEGLPVPARILQREDGKDQMDLRIKSID